MTATSPPPATEAEPGDGGGGSGRRPWLLVVLLLAVAAAVVVAVLVLGGDDDDDGGDSPDDTSGLSLPEPVEEEVDAEGQELLDLLEQGREVNGHSTYTASGDPASIGQELTVQVWRLDGRVRQDSRQVTEAGTVDTAGFLNDDGSIITCNRVDEGAWTCAEQSTASESSPDALFGTVATQLQGQDVVVVDEEIAGRSARCFGVAGADGEVSLCVSTEGLPLRLRGAGSELLLTDFSEDVPEDTFTPPAEPVSADEG
jgi:hypothetical protein